MYYLTPFSKNRDYISFSLSHSKLTLIASSSSLTPHNTVAALQEIPYKRKYSSNLPNVGRVQTALCNRVHCPLHYLMGLSLECVSWFPIRYWNNVLWNYNLQLFTSSMNLSVLLYCLKDNSVFYKINTIICRQHIQYM